MATAILIVCLVLLVAIASAIAAFFYLMARLEELPETLNKSTDEKLLSAKLDLGQYVDTRFAQEAKARQTKEAKPLRKTWPQMRAIAEAGDSEQ